MSNQDSLAVKYRPKKLDDVIGQPIVVKAFKNALKSKTLHHAYILAGAMGSGKTTISRILAAAENCEKRGSDPCGICSNCIDIFNGNSREVIELDAATHGKIDRIREIKKDLYQCPVECRTKYVILDECHSLTSEAAEAALKMIEEPPPFVRFILATTEPQKLKPTIHSRCITWKFNKVNWMEMIPLLEKVCIEEKFDYEKDALTLMARTSKGSVRNSLQNLQSVVNYTGNGKISVQNTREALGVIDEKLYYDLIDNILNADAVKCYLIIENMLKDGKDISIIVNDIYEYLNNIMIVKICKENLSSFGFGEMEVKRYEHHAKKMKGDMVLKVMNLMNNVMFGIEYSLDPQILLNKFVTESILCKARQNKTS